MDWTYVNLRCLTDPWATQSGHTLKSRKIIVKKVCYKLQYITVFLGYFRLRAQSLKGQFISEWKDQIFLAPGREILADFWVPHEIESCNFQTLLVKFWYHLDNFYFHYFKGGTLWKNPINPEICQNCPVLHPRWSGPFDV